MELSSNSFSISITSKILGKYYEKDELVNVDSGLKLQIMLCRTPLFIFRQAWAINSLLWVYLLIPKRCRQLYYVEKKIIYNMREYRMISIIYFSSITIYITI